MVTKKVIDTLYKKYHARPDDPYDLDIALLFEHLVDSHKISIEDDNIVIGGIPPSSPFHKIALANVHGIVEFEDEIAIVLHSSIIFLRKKTPEANIHIKMEKPSWIDKIRFRNSN